MSQTLDELSGKLKQYLAFYGIKPNKSGMAMCPIHSDSNASFHIHNNTWYCFGCGFGGNIFKLAATLEGLPDVGEEGFSSISVPTLAERFGVPYTKTAKGSQTPEQKMRELSRYIFQNLTLTDGYDKFAAERGYTQKIAKKYGIGGLKDYKKMLQHAYKTWGKDIVKAVGFHIGYLFNSRRLLFTVFDHNGQPVAFSGRRTDETPEQKQEDGSTAEAPKYINTPNNPIFKKSQTFYNLNRVKRFDTIYLMEGATDVVTASEAGLPNSLGILSNNLSDQQIGVLRSFKKIIVLLDGDDGGVTKTTELLKKLSNTTAIYLPSRQDPDDFIKEKGLDAILSLEELDDFGWYLATSGFKNKQQVSEAIKLIIQKPPIFHEIYLDLLEANSRVQRKTMDTELQHQLQLRERQRLANILKAVDSQSRVDVSITIKVKDDNIH